MLGLRFVLHTERYKIMLRTLPALLTLILLVSPVAYAQTAPHGSEGGSGTPEGMVYVPAGEFLMGRPSVVREDDDTPQKNVYVDAFYIDIFEVTNSQFANFANATGYVTDIEEKGWAKIVGKKPPAKKVDGANWRHPLGPGSVIDEIMDHPVVLVSWNDAAAYAEWAGKRLPTEAEWEKAARGTDGRKYPWGNQGPDGSQCNLMDRNTPTSAARMRPDFDDGYVLTAPVGTFEGGMSPYGSYDMAGNVSEWCSDWYDKNYYKEGPTVNPKGPSTGFYRVRRGGTYMSDHHRVRSTARGRATPQSASETWGFRCAMDTGEASRAPGPSIVSPVEVKDRSEGEAKPSTPEVVAIWHFDEGDGVTAHDTSGNGNHGTIQGAQWVSGRLGTALEFDGIDDLVDVSSDVLPRTAFSVAFWFNAKAPFGSTTRMDLVAFKGVFIRNDERSQYGSNLAFTVYDNRRYPTVNPTFVPSSDRWYHLAATYDGKSIRLYLNGKLSASEKAYVSENGGGDLGIGAYKWIPRTNVFRGIVDELAVYNGALAEDEIQVLYSNVRSESPTTREETGPEQVVMTYWQTIVKGDYDQAYEVISTKQKKQITGRQHAEHRKTLIDSSLLTIKDIKINSVEHRGDHSLVHYSMKLFGAKGTQWRRGTSRVIKRDDKWSLELSAYFVKNAEDY